MKPGPAPYSLTIPPYPSAKTSLSGEAGDEREMVGDPAIVAEEMPSALSRILEYDGSTSPRKG